MQEKWKFIWVKLNWKFEFNKIRANFLWKKKQIMREGKMKIRTTKKPTKQIVRWKGKAD